MKILNVKIVTKIVCSLIAILVLSVATIGFLVYELYHTESILNDLYGTFNITNNSLSTEKIYIMFYLLQIAADCLKASWILLSF